MSPTLRLPDLSPGEEATIAAVHGPEALHKRLTEMQPYRVLGQYEQPFAHRANVSGVLKAPVMLFWNIDKK